uniref:Uncharacterized protein n=1 Tax=Leptobrachium leishanense TaxID=445787 RepID=A0A8C5LVY9_9ANUR
CSICFFFRQLYYLVLNCGMIVSSALMIWKWLITGSESPIVVVLSGSMELAWWVRLSMRRKTETQIFGPKETIMQWMTEARATTKLAGKQVVGRARGFLYFMFFYAILMVYIQFVCVFA